MTTDKKCLGCGIDLQTTDPLKAGYINDLKNDYCKRCFRIRHYGDYSSFKQEGVSSLKVLKAIEEIEGTILLVLDVTDLESGLFKGIRRHLPNRNFILAVTKRDLLPSTVSESKILSQLARKLKEESIQSSGAVLLGNHSKDNIESLRNLLRKLPAQQNIITAGYANVGKSTLLNALLDEPSKLTISPYPHTTLDIQAFSWEGHTLYDTPGIRLEASLLDLVPHDKIPDVVMNHRLKPITYQLNGDQCFILPYIGSISVFPQGEATLTLYFSETLKIHRTKADHRDAYLEKHQPFSKQAEMKRLVLIKTEEKMDVVFKQIGWVCITGAVEKIEVLSPLKDQVVLRKAMI